MLSSSIKEAVSLQRLMSYMILILYDCAEDGVIHVEDVRAKRIIMRPGPKNSPGEHYESINLYIKIH